MDKFFTSNFGDERWRLYLDGLKFLIQVTFFAAIMGLILGIILAIMNLSDDYFKNSAKGALMQKFNIFKAFSSVYIYIIRGTPALVQLMILNLVVFTGTLRNTSTVVIAAVGFGFNSAAYIAEIVRSGINSIDKGQMEAARAMGMSYTTAMRLIVLPQAFKNMLPTFVNEFIVLIKETSIVGFIAGFDLFRAAEKVTYITYDGISPMIAVALIYLFLTTIFSFAMKYVERRLAKSDR